MRLVKDFITDGCGELANDGQWSSGAIPSWIRRQNPDLDIDVVLSS
jgi:hypothetical protein